MGVIKSGILGGFSGKVANVVGGSWKGIDYMRKLPNSVANPRTTPQVNQRNRFKGISQFASSINSAIIKPLWDRFAQRESGNNAFVKQNIVNFNNLGELATPLQLVISKGKMSKTEIVSAVEQIGGLSVIVTWSDTLTDSFQSPTDIAYILIWNEETGAVATSTSVLRSAETATIAIERRLLSENQYCYLAFKRADGTIVSDSDAIQVSVL